MDRLRLPALAGTVVSLLTAVAVLVPYVLADAGADTIATYYDFGLVTGLTVLMVALVTLVVFASGWRGRSDPATAAGAALGLGFVATLLAASWALAVPYDVVVQLTTESWFEYHRWAVVGSSVAMVVCGLWYAYVLRLFW
ncbi:hypothetical protein L593_04635 [Salinarchaeum sp. Harcht-Bsk1]|uniref:DUF7548 family protein n=1 Tax=Salinarchaeum sp. Harcht-Bsk1 TaxID=1333523 RepID=UPI0003422F1C|nr:hypothetical protein [Salinarchaeum sp. Harcht-Bsk1]AGN00876.1 hypothetical protein L593_04635 [Salinarchaeum sp. Harcht-Bsk1]